MDIKKMNIYELKKCIQIIEKHIKENNFDFKWAKIIIQKHKNI
jgi:hypothetical protein